MRKLILALTALACLIGPAVAQQAPTSTADQGKPGATPWPVSWTSQSVLADLRVSGIPVSAGNPVPVTVGNFPATQPVTQSGTWGVGLNAGTNAIGSVLSDLRVAGAAVAAGNPVPVSGAVTANLGTLNGAALDATLTARLGTLGQKASSASTPVVVASDQPPVPVTFSAADVSAASGGMNYTQIISAASTNAFALKGTPGRLYGFFFVNTSASIKYVKLFNKVGAPVVGTDTPALTIPVPTGPATQIVLGDVGTYFTTGIAIAITGGGATTDTTAVAANDIIGFTLTR